MPRELLDKRDTDFVRDNMLINYCLGDNEELPIDSFMRNNQIDVRFNPQHYYFLMTGAHNKFHSPYTPQTFSHGISETLNAYEAGNALLDANGYTGNFFLIKEDNSKQFGVLFSPTASPSCTPYEIAQALDALYRNTHIAQPEYISTSFVGPYTGYRQCNRAFNEARALNDLLFFGLKGCVITEALRRQTAKPCDITAILANVRALIHTVCCGTLKKALAQADYMVNELVAPSYSMTNFHALYTAVDDLLGMLITVYPEHIHITRRSIHGFYMLCEYKDYLCETLRAVFSQLRGMRRYSPTILLALSFINRNYTQQLSLAQLSEYVYANPSSLSSEFNAEVGVSLSEYVAGLRLNHAKQLLRETDKTIAEVADLSGFTSAKYFREVFKKQTDLSPQQYRDSYSL